MTAISPLHCACGRVSLEAHNAPIITAECHCGSCRVAAQKLQPTAVRPFTESNGGTRFVLYRKDRVVFRKGAELLREFRLVPSAATRRVVATCCGTPVFLEFEKGHWLSLYGAVWPPTTLPKLDLRTMTGDLDDASGLPRDVPNAKRQSVTFMAKLFAAWVAMGFKAPKLNIGRIEPDV